MATINKNILHSKLTSYRLKTLVIIFIIITPLSSQLNSDCILKCYNQLSSKVIPCDDLDFQLTIREKRSKSTVIEYKDVHQPEQDHSQDGSHSFDRPFPDPVVHLRCLKTFQCGPSTTTSPSTTEKLPSPEQIINEQKDKIDNIHSELISNENLNGAELDDSLNNLTNIIANVDYVDDVGISIVANLTKSSLAVVDTVLSRKNTWNNMNDDQKLNSSQKIFNIVANMSKIMNRKQTQQNNTMVQIECSYVSFHSKFSQLNLNETLVFDLKNATIQLRAKGLQSIAKVIARNLDDKQMDEQVQISSTAAIVKNDHAPTRICKEEDKTPNKNILNSPIISFVVGDFPDESIPLKSHYLKLGTKNNQRLQFLDRPKCYYWNITRKCWSSQGCRYQKQNQSRIYSNCECDHLTSFTILVDIYHRDNPKDPVKNILTFLTSALTIICTIVALFISRRYNHETMNVLNDQFRTKSNLFLLNFHLGIWLIVSHFIILFGLDRNDIKFENQILCRIISLLLLYSLLTMICFTFLKCFHCSWFIVFMPLGVTVSSKVYLLIGYCLPMFIIFIGLISFYYNTGQHSLSIFFESLCGEYFCWISSESNPENIWLFVGPTLILFATNAILFSLIMYRYCMNPIHSRSSFSHFYTTLLNSFLFFCNFGLTWLLSIFYINKKLPYFFSILFILLNGSQGVFLLIEQLFRFYKRKNRIERIKTTSSRLVNSTTSSTINKPSFDVDCNGKKETYPTKKIMKHQVISNVIINNKRQKKKKKISDSTNKS